MARSNLEQFKLTDEQSKWLNDKSEKTMIPKAAILRSLVQKAVDADKEKQK